METFNKNSFVETKVIEKEIEGKYGKFAVKNILMSLRYKDNEKREILIFGNELEDAIEALKKIQGSLYPERCLSNEEFKEGSATVYQKDGKYYFSGDIEHCEKENIFYNARLIKSVLENSKNKYGHKNYDDSCHFRKSVDYEKLDWDRVNIYREDLYVFNDDEIVLHKKYSKEDEDSFLRENYDNGF